MGNLILRQIENNSDKFKAAEGGFINTSRVKILVTSYY